MKLSSFLAQREALLQQARLANLAFAYERLSDFARRIARTGLRGRLRLRQAPPDGDVCWASLTALDGSQSVVDEHFTDEDLMDFADIAAFAIGETDIDLEFPIPHLESLLLAPLRSQLEEAGVAIDSTPPHR